MDEDLSTLERQWAANPQDRAVGRRLGLLYQRTGRLIKGKTIDRWRVELLESSLMDQEAAAAALAGLGPLASGALPELCQALAGARSWIRIFILRALGAIGDARSCPAILALLGESLSVQEAVAEALAAIDDRRLIPQLIERARQGPTAERRGAMMALGQMVAAEAWPVLAAAIEEGAEDFLREAVLAAARLGQPACLPLFDRLLDDGPGLTRRLAVIEALALIDDEAVFPVLERAFHDRAMGVRRAAAQVAGSKKQQAALPGLGLAIHDAHPWVRRAAVQALRQIDGTEARVLLERASRDRDEHVREAAQAALGAKHERS